MTSWADDRWELEAGVVRPYLLTKGRTRNQRGDLAVEVMVETTVRGKQVAPRLQTEQRTIVELCRTPQSVAEVSAKLRAPFGVIQVLVGDLADDELVHTHDAWSGSGASDLVDDVALLQRLITRVKAIPVG